jgi:hypothetical protein
MIETGDPDQFDETLMNTNTNAAQKIRANDTRSPFVRAKPDGRAIPRRSQDSDQGRGRGRDIYPRLETQYIQSISVCTGKSHVADAIDERH